MINSIKTLGIQIRYLPLAWRVSKYTDRSSYQNHYLGQLWKVLNPILQSSIYFVMFGLGLRKVIGFPGGTLGYLGWLLLGFGVWRFIQQSIISGSTSIQSQMSLATKMNFPLSVLPTMAIVAQMWTLISLSALSVVFTLLSGQSFSNHSWESMYYLIATFIFVYSLALFSSTIAILIPDFVPLLRVVMQMGMWVAGVIVNIDEFHSVMGDVLKLSPFYYLVAGFRHAVLGAEPTFMTLFVKDSIIFWCFTIAILMVGTHLHLKFRDNFMDYM